MHTYTHTYHRTHIHAYARANGDDSLSMMLVGNCVSVCFRSCLLSTHWQDGTVYILLGTFSCMLLVYGTTESAPPTSPYQLVWSLKLPFPIVSIHVFDVDEVWCDCCFGALWFHTDVFELHASSYMSAGAVFIYAHCASMQTDVHTPSTAHFSDACVQEYVLLLLLVAMGQLMVCTGTQNKNKTKLIFAVLCCDESNRTALMKWLCLLCLAFTCCGCPWSSYWPRCPTYSQHSVRGVYVYAEGL